MTKRIKLYPVDILNLDRIIKRVSVDTLPEYQQNSDTLRFRDNYKNAADNFREQHTKDKKDIKLYEFEIEWINVGFHRYLRELEIQELQGLQKINKLQELQEKYLESVSYDSKSIHRQGNLTIT